MTPQPDWSRADFEFAYFNMVLGKDTKGYERIDRAYLETKDATSGDNRHSWQAFSQLWRLRLAEGGSLANLAALAEEHPDSSRTLEYLAKGYEVYSDYVKSGSTYEKSASKSNDEAEKLGLLGRAAVAHVRAGSSENAYSVVRQMRIQVGASESGELQLLKVLRSISELEKKDEMALGIMEPCLSG